MWGKFTLQKKKTHVKGKQKTGFFSFLWVHLTNEKWTFLCSAPLVNQPHGYFVFVAWRRVRTNIRFLSVLPLGRFPLTIYPGGTVTHRKWISLTGIQAGEKKKLDKKKFYCFFVKVSLNYELSSVDCLFLVVRKRERPSAFCCLCSYWKDLTYLPVLEQ